MTDPSQPSPSERFSASDKNFPTIHAPSLNEGLAALQRREYELAIAHLEGIRQSSPDRTSRVKAEMGLVTAYEQTGQIQRAIAYCRFLTENPHPSIRQRATQALERLTKKQAAFSPIEMTSPTTDPVLSDETGFVPLGTPQPSISEDDTGFIPLTQPPASGSRPRAERNPLSSHDGMDTASPLHVDSPQFYETPITPDLSPELTNPSDSGNHRRFSPTAEGSVSLPPTPSPRPSTTSSSAAPGVIGKQAGRTKNGGSLGKMDITQLWGVEAITAIALVYLIRAFVQVVFQGFNQVVWRLSWLNLGQFAIYTDPFWGVVIGLAILFFLSPWMFDRLFRSIYGSKSLTWELLGRYSPESVSLLKQLFTQKRLPLPTLSILYTSTPLALTYGYLPRHARIVISQGLLEQLADDEIACVLAGESSHIFNRSFAVLSWVALVAQFPYLIYWKVSTWGDQVQNSGLRGIAVGISALSYGVYFLIHGVGLWLSRVRLYYSDRTACEFTGNPNGLSRALLKLAQGTAKDIQRQGYTAPLVENCDLLTPVGYKTILSLGSMVSQASVESLLAWDHQNPYRRWLAIPYAHPPLGDRLHQLTRYARQWRLETEFELPTKLAIVLTRPLRRPQTFWLQIAPWLGLLIGLGMAIALWLFGNLAYVLRWDLFSWMRQDWSLIWGLSCIGFSVGLFLRINPFFPDIKRHTTQVDPTLTTWFMDPTLLPVDGQPVRLQGRLLGRRGLGNILVQDLMLASSTGLIKLHCESPLGAVGHLIPQSPRPLDFLNRSVWVTGWLRRGVEPCVDVEAIQAQSQGLRGGHPLWSTALAVLTALAGAYIIMRGG